MTTESQLLGLVPVAATARLVEDVSTPRRRKKKKSYADYMCTGRYPKL